MKTVFLTGISGLLGSQIAQLLLENNYQVTGLLRTRRNYGGAQHPHLTLIEGDLFIELSRYLQNVDVIIHAAAETRQGIANYAAYRRINFDATVSLLQTAIHCKVKHFIYISTANTMAYGDQHKPGDGSPPITYPFDQSFYAKSKLEAEQYLMKHNDQIKVSIVNPTFMIGPSFQLRSSNRIISLAWKKRVIFFPKGGKNFVHIGNVVQVIAKLIQADEACERILVAGENLTYHDFYRKLLVLSNQKSLLISVPNRLLLLIGHIGNLVRKLGCNNSFILNNMKILTSCNFYSNSSSLQLLNGQYKSIEEAIQEAIQLLNKKSS